MNETLTALARRKSVRVYEQREIAPQIKDAILAAALQAPSAGNMALYTVLDITDTALKERLSVTCDNQAFIAKAPIVLVFLADYQRWYDCFASTCSQTMRKPGEGDLLLACCDALIAAQNVVVAAESLGLGSCYIGDIIENFEIHRELLGLPPYVLPITMLCLGYPTPGQQAREKPPRFALEDIVCQNTYRRQEPAEWLTRYTKREGLKQDDGSLAVQALCKRKWESDFSKEMTRSAAKMIEAWKQGSPPARLGPGPAL